jgi:hypothetical protein
MRLLSHSGLTRQNPQPERVGGFLMPKNCTLTRSKNFQHKPLPQRQQQGARGTQRGSKKKFQHKQCAQRSARHTPRGTHASGLTR